jgi:hypothetical protein
MELASTSNDPTSCFWFFVLIAQRIKNRKLIFRQLAFAIAIVLQLFIIKKKIFELLIKFKKSNN